MNDVAEVIKAIAQETGADVRTVTKFFAGVPARGAARRAIERAAAARGIVCNGMPLAISAAPRPAA